MIRKLNFSWSEPLNDLFKILLKKESRFLNFENGTNILSVLICIA